LKWVAGHEGSIDLALTDVVLPGINGKQLVERLKALHPESKVLFTSGFSEELIAYRGVLDPGVAYIAKPYSPEDLEDPRGVRVENTTKVNGNPSFRRSF